MTSIALPGTVSASVVAAAAKRMSEARMHLIQHFPFFGSLAMRLKLEPLAGIPVMGVDGVTCVYNPSWVVAQPFDFVVGVLAHECMHCALGHPYRRGARDHKRFNVACDHAINPLLVMSGLKLPPEGLNDPQYHGLSAEEIYYRLPTQSGGGAGGGGDDPGSATGQFSDGVGGDGRPAEQAELSRQLGEWEIALNQAIATATAAGQLDPEAREWLLNAGGRATVDWRTVLRDWLSECNPTGQSWTPPNRRFIHRGAYLPAATGRTMGELAILVDTSGSTWAEEIFKRFAAEITAIVDEVQPEAVHVLYWDARFRGYERFDQGERLAFNARGGGGTNFSGVWEWFADEGIEPVACVAFSDLMLSSFGPEPDYPVLWASVGRSRAPFGSVIHLDRQ